jgi:RNA polymerase primary sigma factor
MPGPLSLYMRDAGEVPLLTVQEEIKLARRIKRGDAAARERMIRANLRLVVKIARDYEGFGLPLLDLISEGNIGLMRAVDKFDPKKGAKLSTYAALWIKQQMRRALANQTKTIRLPVHMVDKVAAMRRALDEHQEQHGRPPTDEELATRLGVPVRKARLIRMSAQRTSSLDAPLGDEDDSSRLGEIVADQSAVNAADELDRKTLTSLMMELLHTLNQREATILTLRFGLDGSEERTLEEIGDKLGVTRERIRQLQNEALSKLRRQLRTREGWPLAA